MGENQSFEMESWGSAFQKQIHLSVPGAIHIHVRAYTRLLIIKYQSSVLRLQMQMLIFVEPLSALSIFYLNICWTQRVGSGAVVSESVQSFVNTPLQPDAMPGVEPLFTAQVNKAVLVEMITKWWQ